MPSIEANPDQVIALVVCFNSHHELLLLQRPDELHCGGFWSYPGGKVHEGESPLHAAVRELHEETGIKGKLWRHLGKASHSYADRTLHFLFFVCQTDDTATLQPESPHAWVARHALDHYPMPEANQKLTPMLMMPEMEVYLTGSCR